MREKANLETLGETSRGRTDFRHERSMHEVGVVAKGLETRCECELDLSDGGVGGRSCSWS